MIEILQYQATYPDAWHLNVGDDVARAYAVNAATAVELLALAEEARQPMAVTAREG